MRTFSPYKGRSQPISLKWIWRESAVANGLVIVVGSSNPNPEEKRKKKKEKGGWWWGEGESLDRFLQWLNTWGREKTFTVERKSKNGVLVDHGLRAHGRKRKKLEQRVFTQRKRLKNEFRIYSSEQRTVIRTNLMKSRLNLRGKGSQEILFSPPQMTK